MSSAVRRPDAARTGLAGAGILLVVLFAVTAWAAGSDSSGSDPVSGPVTAESPAPEEPDEGPTAPQPGDTVPPEAFLAQVAAAAGENTSAELTLTLELGGREVTATGEVDYAELPAKSHLSAPSPFGGGEVDLVVDGTILYAKAGLLTGGRYVRIDLENPPAVIGDLGPLAQNANVLAAFAALAAQADRVTYVGPDEVDGEPLSHYRLEVDSAKLASLGSLPGLDDLPDTVVVDAWLTAESQVRRVSLDLGPSTGLTAVVTEWGAPVSIDVPDKSEVAELPSFVM